MTKEEFDRTMRQRMSDTYERVARGELTKEQAAQELGYKSWSQMEQVRHRRGLLSLARLTRRTAKHISDDDIMDGMDRINDGEDPDTVAWEIGFRDWTHMSTTRVQRNMPSLRELRGGYGRTTDMDAYKQLLSSMVDKAVRHEVSWEKVMAQFGKHDLNGLYDMMRNLGLKNVTERKKEYRQERIAAKKQNQFKISG